MASDDPAEAVFDGVAYWRARAIEDLALVGEERMAAAAEGAGYPVALRPLAVHFPHGPGVRIVDLGAGLGGATRWLAEATDSRVVGVEPSPASADAAARLFPGLHVVNGRAGATPLRSRAFDAVALLGVTSLIDDLQPLLGEVRRLLGGHGVIGVSDLFRDRHGAGALDHPPNTYRTLTGLSEILDAHGFEIREVVSIGLDQRMPWRDVTDRIDEHVAKRRAGTPELDRWEGDQSRLQQTIETDELVVGTLVAELATR